MKMKYAALLAAAAPDAGRGAGLGAPRFRGGVRRQEAGPPGRRRDQGGIDQSARLDPRGREGAGWQGDLAGWWRPAAPTCCCGAVSPKPPWRPGRRVVVDGYQSKDGSMRANGRDITLPDGQKLFLGSSGTGAPYDEEEVRRQIHAECESSAIR